MARRITTSPTSSPALIPSAILQAIKAAAKAAGKDENYYLSIPIGTRCGPRVRRLLRVVGVVWAVVAVRSPSDPARRRRI